MLEWLNNALEYIMAIFWVKVVLQIFLIVATVAFFYFGNKLLPLKYKPSERKLKNLIFKIREYADTVVSPEDDIGKIFYKAFTMLGLLFGESETKEKELLDYAKELANPLKMYQDNFFMQSILPIIETEAKEIVQVFQSTIELNQICLKSTFTVDGQDVSLYYYKEKKSLENSRNLISNHFLCDAEFDYRKLAKLLFKKYGTRLYLAGGDSGKISVSPLEHDPGRDNYILDEILYKQVKNDVDKFKELSIQRSYLLIGPPGTGKSTFCLEVATKLDGTFVKLNKNFIESLENKNVKMVLSYLSPDVIVIDDIDRITGNVNMQLLLHILEDVKTLPTMPVLIATANDIRKMDDAILRPGRFDEIVEFDFPTLAERKMFIKTYIGKLGLVIEDNVLDKFANATKGMTQAYLKEYCYYYKIENGEIDKIIKKIDIRKEIQNPSLKKKKKDNPEEQQSSPKEISASKKTSSKNEDSNFPYKLEDFYAKPPASLRETLQEEKEDMEENEIMAPPGMDSEYDDDDVFGDEEPEEDDIDD